ncbi:hypothetical protein LSTR_LSTR013660 [Laodelphax striatellus]|uniref:Probable imidazolonepropionase n=1 Tax=Laodelphax striatellus TaxID=195883 RepID=A0A482WHX9_LAOST|nr:hypothetical protein LSTR_LSTR013660 [Laodelphax striatellus]
MDRKSYSSDDDSSFDDELPYLQMSPPPAPKSTPPTPNGRLKLMVHSARQVVTPSFDPLTPYLAGKRQANITVLEEDPLTGGVGIAVNHDGLIVYIGRTDRMRVIYRDFTVDKHIDATGMCVLPGFVDAHTHPVWAGDRIDEFAMKLRGMSYMEIHEAGGGIFSTVDATSAAKTSSIYNALCIRLKKMAESGTTLVECKSGYGLELNKEVRLLEVLQQAKSSQKNTINMSITYCGAHAIPRNSNMEEATKRIVDVDLPYIAHLNKTGKLDVENVDVFCDRGVFSEQHAELILWKAKSLGFQLNFHGDELYPMNSGQMGARVGATAISHLERIGEADMGGMRRAKRTVAVLLPSTGFAMRLRPPPARKLIAARVPVALGSDFNPNVYCYSMPLIMNLACVYLRMTMEEALVAATLNAAASLGKSDKHGSIVYNKFADLVIINSPRWENIIYDFGNHGQIIKFVVMAGNIVKGPKHFDGSLPPRLRTDDVLQKRRRRRSTSLKMEGERKRRHSKCSPPPPPPHSHTQHQSIVCWYEEQIEAIKRKYKEDLQAVTRRYDRALNSKTGLYQCLVQAASHNRHERTDADDIQAGGAGSSSKM